MPIALVANAAAVGQTGAFKYGRFGMDRRAFLAATVVTSGVAAALAPPADAANSPVRLTWPKALASGDTVGVVAPSRTIIDPEDFALIELTITHFGLNPAIGRHVHGRSRDIRESIKERVADIHDLFNDPSVKAVFCARGGYGASELLPEIDYGVIKKNPKIFMGYSDITVLHQAFRKQANLVTFHGPMPVASKFTDFTQNWFRKAVFSNQPIGLVGSPDQPGALRPKYPLRTIVGGRATGPVVGGNLSMIVNLLATPNEIDSKGALLFLEDTDEEPYRIGRMLVQLRQAGKFDQAVGVVFGRCQDCGPSDYKPSFSSPYTLGEHIDQVLGDLPIPSVYGFALGHTDDQLTIPLGVVATLDAGARTLEFHESGLT